MLLSFYASIDNIHVSRYNDCIDNELGVFK